MQSSDACPQLAVSDGGPRTSARNAVTSTGCPDLNGLAGPDQFEALRSYVSHELIAVRLSCDESKTFRAAARANRFGAVGNFDVRVENPLVVSRPRSLITSSDPRFLKVSLQLHGKSLVAQAERQASLGPGDFVLLDTARPFRISTRGMVHMSNFVFPRDTMRLSDSQLENLIARPVSGQDGLGSLVSEFLARLSQHVNPAGASSTWHLSEAALELLAAAFATRLFCVGTTELDIGRASVLLPILTHIRQRLSDPDLNVSSIASAHFMSVRALQRIFEGQGQTVTGWIRSERLEQCRKDLSNPALSRLPVYAIATRWGFVDAAHFSRLFTSTYGLSPLKYRTSVVRQLRNPARGAYAAASQVIPL